jgi:hypothetical protein
MQSAPQSPEAPHYHYDPNFGDRQATYAKVNFQTHPQHRPEVAARFVACVEGETIMSTIHGRHTVSWRVEPGTPCLILGWWTDGTVHVKWPIIAGNYMVDGRFPSWVVAEDPSALMAGGGRVLLANDPPPRRRPVPMRLAGLVILLLVVLVLLLVPAAREALLMLGGRS